MKKIILILLSLILLCTMCIGFVACDKDEDTLPIPLEPETISLFNFAKESTFSFGKFEVGEIIGLGRRELYGEAYASAAAPDPQYENKTALLMCNDTAYLPTESALQTIFDKYADTVEGSKASVVVETGAREQTIAHYVERKKGAFTGYSSYVDGKYVKDYLEEKKVGETYYVNNDLLLKKEQKGDWLVGYMIDLQLDERLSEYDNNKFSHISVDFIVHKYNKTEDIVVRMEVLLEIIYPYSAFEEDDEVLLLAYALDYGTIAYNALNEATLEEKLEMGSEYFEAMEEVIDAWLDDPRGQAYINKYYS